MYVRSLLRIELAVVLLMICASAAAQPSERANRSDAVQGNAKNPKGDVALTGCVDEESGHYVLTDDRNLKPIADLEAAGFPPEGFAKYLGHKVTVRGESSSGGIRPLFRVRSIETISETCAQPPRQ